ncbi:MULTISPECIES: transporter [Streptomyces]|uniref:transporter n=1 Tax=Streptomyces TaxID=1883 RepID=UPI00140888B4|nr:MULTISPECIES: transporter [Streptomyces]
MVRLKLAIMRNGLRRSGGRRAAYIASAVMVLLLAAFLLLGLLLLRGNPHAASVVVPLTALLALGWAVMPLFSSSGDETLDATRLVLLPLRPRPLVRALLAASLVGIGPLFTLCLLAGSAIAVARGPAAAVTGVVAVALALLTCVALARAVVTANTRLLSSRRGRDLAVVSGLVVAIGAQAVNFGVQRLGSSGLAQLDPFAEVLRWVPPASAIGAVASAGDGAYGTALVQLALTALALTLALRWWSATLTRLMTAPDASTLQAAEPAAVRAARRPGGSGFARLLPPGRIPTVMERSLRYAWRDPKTRAALVVSLAVGLIVPLFNALQGSGSVYFACFAAGMLGSMMYNQFGQDYSGFWMVAMTISTPRDALRELWGRALALMSYAVPYSVLVCVATVAVLDDWEKLPEALGLSLSLLGAMTATGAWASVRHPYSIPPEGNRNVAPGQVGLVWMAIAGGMAGAALLSAPVIALTVWLHVAGHAAAWSWVLLPVGAAYGALLTVAGLRLAAPRAAARLPEILAAVSKG